MPALATAAPRYDPSGDDFVIAESAGEWFHVSDAPPQCFSVAELFGVPYALFWDWATTTTFVVGKQLITRVAKPVWYADFQAQQFAEQEYDYPGFESGELYVHATWLEHFNTQATPPWFLPFMPPLPAPPRPPRYRRNPARANPTCRLCRPGEPVRRAVWTMRGECACADARANPMGYIDSEERFAATGSPRDQIPPGVYSIIEYLGCCEEHGLSRIVVTRGEEPLAMFGLGRNLDPSGLWDEAQLFVAAHQLFYRDIRPVWVRPLKWTEPVGESEAEFYAAFGGNSDDYFDAMHANVAIYPPFPFEGFHVRWYPYHLSAALELPPPAPPPGMVVEPEPPAVVEMREQYAAALPETRKALEAFAQERAGERPRRRRLLGGSR